MTKFSMISKVAATAILGAVLFTGCGSSDSTTSSTPTSTDKNDTIPVVPDLNETNATTTDMQLTDGYLAGTGRIMVDGVEKSGIKAMGEGKISFNGKANKSITIVKGPGFLLISMIME